MKQTIVIAIICLAAGALAQRQWDNKEIQKLVDEKSTLEKNRTVTVIKKIIRPDGTIEEDSTKTEDTIKKETEKHTAESSKPAYNPQWFISGGVSIERVYKLEVSRQIIGPVWIGVYGTSKNEVGASLGVLF